MSKQITVSGQEVNPNTVEEMIDSNGSPAYVDPVRRFIIGYPIDAIVTPLEDVPGGVVSFTSPGVTNTTSVDIRVSEFDGTDINLEEHVGSVLAGLKNGSIPDFNALQDPECERYVLDDNEACTIVYGADIQTNDNSPLQHMRILQIYSIIQDNIFNIALSAHEDQFSNRSSIIGAMVSSFELLDDDLNSSTIPRFS